MDCIDCHTSRDVMGDGYAYENMYLQTEIACEDCHGGADRPRYREISRRERRSDTRVEKLSHPDAAGDEDDPHRQGTPLLQCVLPGRHCVCSWVSGAARLFQSKVITGTPEHTIVGHGGWNVPPAIRGRLPSAMVVIPNTIRRRTGIDYIKDEVTPGRFSETEDYRMLYPFPLALNQRGKISPVTPGCQTFVTVVEADGSASKKRVCGKYKGRPQLRFAPFYSHNTGKKAVGCGECHGNPAFLGFGQHVVEGDTIKATLLCEKSKDKPLDGYLTLQRGKVKAFSAITRESSRPLNGQRGAKDAGGQPLHGLSRQGKGPHLPKGTRLSCA